MKVRAVVAVLGPGLAAFAAGAVSFDFLSCCPAEQTATGARIVWHSDGDSCTLWYSRASAPESAVEAPCEKAHKPIAFRDCDADYYKYTATLSSLEPGTEYIYYVKSGGARSGVQKFKTAGTGGCYNFLWASDVHASPEARTMFAMDTLELMRRDAEARTASSGGIDFVLFSGDAVRYGSRYDNWRKWNGAPVMANYMLAAVPGNKEYYYKGRSTFNHNKWYLALKNNPQNGPLATEQEGCYWFLRDSVLFVGVDSLVHKGLEMRRHGDAVNVLREQTNWFDRVVTEQRRKKGFRYLVVFQHDPWFVCDGAADGKADKSRGNYDTWRHVFDKHKVDLALSGAEHNYVRSAPLRGDEESDEGTVYMATGEIASTNYAATVTAGVGKYFARVGATGASCGASWIEVRPDSMKLTHFWDKCQSPEFKVLDTVTIAPKDRGFEYE